MRSPYESKNRKPSGEKEQIDRLKWKGRKLKVRPASEVMEEIEKTRKKLNELKAKLVSSRKY